MVNASVNPKTAQMITEAVTDILGMPADRVFMNLDDVAITDWGFRGTTIDKLQK